MIIIPAIDLRQGRCVRLAQGDFNRTTVYAEDPLEVALLWRSKGARRLHVVDLDGSLTGEPRHREVIGRIVKETGLAVQVGGGIRDLATLEGYLSLGANWVILGTAVVEDPGFVRRACRLFPGRVILGVDAAAGMVALQGWTRQSSVAAVDLVRSFADEGAAAVVYTDILRDGMQSGVNAEETGRFAEAVGIPVIASGGVAGIEDLRRLLEVQHKGVTGVIVGRALYSGALALEEGIALLEERG
jgi:phosphoribosylformimino-5-aminoimidazole carboxamide ribotide isomerase